MTKKMLIDATHAEETRVVVVDGNKVEDFDFESLNKRQLAGNIYLAKVTRVEPSLQAAFVEYGGNRHGFLAFSEIHPDYYQIPKADREALIAEEAALAREAEEEAAREKPKPAAAGRASRRRAAAEATTGDAVVASEAVTEINPPADVAAGDLEDVPPPSAAAGDIEIDVPDEPNGAAPAEAARPAADPADAAVEEDEEDRGEVEGYESVGGDDVQEERAPRKPMRQRRYKIQEVIKVRQILLVQVVKEERGNKGAALTTYLSLAGRYCVLMPNTARGGGISRKITNAADRKKLKEISGSITVPEGAGLIIRTAGAARTKTEIKRDYEYLLRQWEQIRELTLKSIAPAPIYEEGSLIKRTIRDLYSREMDEVLVDGERGYREAKDYMKMLMPSHAKNVKHYADAAAAVLALPGRELPLGDVQPGGAAQVRRLHRHRRHRGAGRDRRELGAGDARGLDRGHRAQDQPRGRRGGGAADAAARPRGPHRHRLHRHGGPASNNAAVEKRLKDKLKTDRARIQVGRISPFGLLEMSRQRLRPGMIEATTKGCPHCHGTGRVRSDDSLALALLREVEEEGVKARSKEVLIVAPVEIANYLLNQKREHVAMIEQRFGLSVRVEGDASLISPDYKLEKFKTASRIVPAPERLELTTVAYPAEEEIEEEEAEEEVAEAPEAAGEKPGGKRKRRRRRRGGKPGQAAPAEAAAEPVAEESPADEPAEALAVPAAEAAEPAPARTRSRRRSRKGPEEADTPAPVAARRAGSRLAEGPSPFGEMIDLGEPDGAGDRRGARGRRAAAAARGERVRKPVTAVLAEVVSATVEAITPDGASPSPSPSPRPPPSRRSRPTRRPSRRRRRRRRPRRGRSAAAGGRGRSAAPDARRPGLEPAQPLGDVGGRRRRRRSAGCGAAHRVEVEAGGHRDPGLGQDAGGERAAVVGQVADVGVDVEGAVGRGDVAEAGARQPSSISARLAR